MLVKHKLEKNDIIPLLEIIKEEYGLKNIFFIIFSILFMGVFRTWINVNIKNDNYLYLHIISILFFLFFFVIGIIPFMKIIMKNIFLITWLSFNKILIQLVKVIIFVVFLVCVIHLFQYFYLECLDPFKGK